MKNKKELEGWDTLENYLINTRYSIRNPESNEAEEKNYDDVINRIIIELTKKSTEISEFVETTHLYEALKDRLIIVATPFLMSYGNPYTNRKGYFSCYPLGRVDDSMEGINKICQIMEKIYQSGGGAGIDISKLRQKNSSVDNGQGVASGAVGFLPRFDAITGTTNQGGRRRGALLIQMDWDYPDINDFISAKNFGAKMAQLIATLPEEERPAQNPVFSNMNLSVNVFGKFWDDPDMINRIAKNMWTCADPGLLFIDNAFKYSPYRAEDEPIFSNPCGEYLAPSFTSCNLLTVNVAKIAKQTLSHKSASKRKFFETVAFYSELAARLGSYITTLDEGYPNEEIRIKTQKSRPVGVGMSGFHTSLLLAFNGEEPYGSDKAIKFAEQTQAWLTYGTLKGSAELAEKYNLFYENKEYWDNHIEELMEIIPAERLKPLQKSVSNFGGFYNAITTSQAPTGSVSCFLRNIDSGVEPFYAMTVERSVRDFEDKWKKFTLQPYYLMEKFDKDPDFRKRAEEQTATKLAPKAQLDMLAAFQKYIHTACSKTINVAEETTVKEIENLILIAKDIRLKGFTLYREGCREAVLQDAKRQKSLINICPLADEREGKTIRVKGPVTTYITVNHDEEERIREVFVQAGDVGTTLNSMFAAFGMLLSKVLTLYPDSINNFIHLLSKIQAGDFYSYRKKRANSLPHVIAMILIDRISELKAEVSTGEEVSKTLDICPSCQNLTFKREGSCKNCTNCGFSSC